MTRYLKILSCALCAAALTSCSFLHDDQVVARAEGKKLYKSEVVKYIPHGIPAEDSIALANQYIKAWAAELIMNAMADKQLTKKEKDVSSELEDYKSSLLKYRYEQKYIADRLDTAVTDNQIEEHYKSNPNLYVLSVPIVKARYMRLPKASSMKDDLVKLLPGKKDGDLALLDSLSRTYADKYVDYGDEWMDIVALSREYGMDYGTLIGAMDGPVIDIVDEQGTDHIAYITDYMRRGSVAPIEYCRDKIREMIVSQRKYALSRALEQDLLDDALKKGNFVVYGTED
ncbi:MAG: hypothetical protein MJY55_04115 [Bacteroidales bacterium]|nr:hypothetical protein [Bacteroidales bacterium]